MKRAFLYICLILLPLLFACSGQEGKVIPRKTLSKIYAEMFVVDQRINYYWEARSMADTSLVYEPIFEKYGYTSDDYRASVAKYLKDPDRYARILRETTLIVEAELKELQREKKRMEEEQERLNAVTELYDAYQPERFFYLTSLKNPNLSYDDSLSFYVDSTGGELYFDTREWLDTAYYGPLVKIDTTMFAAPKDSLSFSDSIAVDGIAAPEDSLSVPSKNTDVQQGKLRLSKDSLNLKDFEKPVKFEKSNLNLKIKTDNQ